VRLLAFSPQAALVLLASVSAVIVLAYLLRPRRRRVIVASNLLWRRVAAGAPIRRERWRWWLSLALALTIGLAIALALTRPEVAAIAGTARRIVLVMDDAPSMAARTRDGQSRWLHALVRARHVIASAGPASEFMVLDTMGQAAIPEFVVAREALAQLARLEPAVTGSARMPWVPPATAADLPHEVLLTDGVAPLEVPSAAEVVSVFEPADNVAITAFEARAQPHDPTRYEAVAQVLNASPADRHTSIELSGADGFAVTRELDVPAGQTVVAVIDVSAFAGGTLKARVRMQDDAFAPDDEAYAVVGRHRARKVLLVTAGNPRLEQALRLLPAVALAVVKPEGYVATAQAESRADVLDAVPAGRARGDETWRRAPDLYVFDGWAPPEAPPAGALAFGTPTVPWLGSAATEVRKPTITQWDRSHPLVHDVVWRELRIRRGVLAEMPGSADGAAVVLARGAGNVALERALISAGETSKRWIRVGFALGDSNLPYQSGFPVFLGHAIEWLDPRPEPLARGLGAVDLPWSGAAVSDSEHRPVATLATGSGTRFEASAPGVYTARQDGRERVVVVNALDPQRAEINRSRFAGAVAAEPAQPRPRPLSKVEPWLLLIAAAALLLVIEWLTFSRRWTV
jgi:Ca-activated chloride channel homolog